MNTPIFSNKGIYQSDSYLNLLPGTFYALKTTKDV